MTAWVARDGFTQIKGAGAGAVAIAAEEGGEAITCPLPPAPPGGAAARPRHGDMPLIAPRMAGRGPGSSGSPARRRRCAASSCPRSPSASSTPPQRSRGHRRGRGPLRRRGRLRGRHLGRRRRGRHAADERPGRQPSRLPAVLRRRPLDPLGRRRVGRQPGRRQQRRQRRRAGSRSMARCRPSPGVAAGEYRRQPARSR